MKLSRIQVDMLGALIVREGDCRFVRSEAREEFIRLARIGALHEDALPTPTPRRRDGYPDNPGTEP